MKMKRTLSAVAVVVAGAVSGNVSAMVAEWDFTTFGGFFSNDGTGAPNPQCSNADCNLAASQGDTPGLGFVDLGGGLTGELFSRLQWGTPFPGGNGLQSGAQIFNGASNTTVSPTPFLGLTAVEVVFDRIVTNGDWTATGYVAQYNNVITESGGFFNSGLFVSVFNLTDPAGPTPVPTFNPAVVPLNVNFLETVNETDIADCDQTDNLANTGCDDVITIDKLPSGLLAGVPFTYDGVDYIIQSRVSGFQGSIVRDLGNRDEVFTPEPLPPPGVSYLIQETRIFVRPPNEVPVPGVLALMGFGLFAMAMRTRRQRR